MSDRKPFWIDDPLILLTDFQLVPKADLSFDEKLNTLTRLVIIISVGMFAMEYPQWHMFLLVGLLFILILKIANNRREGFSIPATYVDGAEPMTTVPPLHAEEWQSPAPIYDEYTNAPMQVTEVEDERPIVGQYISASNLFPFQKNEINTRPLTDAQLYMNDEFTRDALQFRNDMTRNYVNKIDRMYRHGCADQISPWNSY